MLAAYFIHTTDTEKAETGSVREEGTVGGE